MKIPVSSNGNTVYAFKAISGKGSSGTYGIVLSGLTPSAIGQTSPEPEDISAKLNAAITVLRQKGRNGGTIFIPPGTYYFGTTIEFAGQGIQLVGLRGAPPRGDSNPREGSYPTFWYNRSLQDPNYKPNANTAKPGGTAFGQTTRPRSRVLGSATDTTGATPGYSTAVYSYNNIMGLNVAYSDTGSGGVGATATGMLFYYSHLNLIRDISICGAYNGIDLICNESTSLRNISITGLRGDFGMSCGSEANEAHMGRSANKEAGLAETRIGRTNGLKIQGLTVSAHNNTTRLVVLPTAAELSGVNLSGGGIGIDIGDPVDAIQGLSNETRADDVYLQDVTIDGCGQQGILTNYASNIFGYNVSISNSGAEGMRIQPGLYGDFQFGRLSISNSQSTGLLIENGINIVMTDVTVKNSNLSGTIVPGMPEAL